jgi:hypothetical protein
LIVTGRNNYHRLLLFQKSLLNRSHTGCMLLLLLLLNPTAAHCTRNHGFVKHNRAFDAHALFLLLFFLPVLVIILNLTH